MYEILRNSQHLVYREMIYRNIGVFVNNNILLIFLYSRVFEIIS